MNKPAEGNSKIMLVESPLLAGLIRSEVIDWAQKLKVSLEHLERMQAEGLMGTTLTVKSVFAEASQQAGGLLKNMEVLAGLAETYAGQSEDSRERLFLFALLNGIIKSKFSAHPGRFVLKDSDREAAPVYGNKRWLELMLTHLLHELDTSIHPFEQRIVLTIRQLGNHMILRAQNESIPHHERSRNKSSVEWLEGMTLNLCRRIAELHGGTLRLDSNEVYDSYELTGFVLSIPTSSPQVEESFRCSDCSLIKQIENYANDLAELMDRCQELEETRRAQDGQAANC
jgi:hypothetical protein